MPDPSLHARLAAFAAGHPGWRTRFAPAPTGWLHLGHAVNAAWVWSVARAFGGCILLRIEDHDPLRCRPEYEAGLLEDLDWLGLAPDEATTASYRAPGPHPMRQRDRGAAYAQAMAGLEDAGLAFPCRCSRRDIARAVGDAAEEAAGERPYPGTCREAGVPASETEARRVRLPDETVAFDDLRLGSQAQRPARQCGDVLVRDRHGAWTYQFAVVVDDLAQRVGLVIRGEDLLASTGRQTLLARALGGTPPVTLHHPLVRHPDGTKLSKSRGDAGLRELRAQGRAPEEVLGLAAHLGGLQATAAPIAAAELAALWAAPRDGASGP